ncbi:hypothetical protein B0A50_07182 [Salinomyces thailandicus]|uniref:Uncharacterized protein n=1 Tax=Salinomyces thailandicus TaxID=706561 RepID=A0A4U0TN17_9PEZI|nr:hypothetical protein B0A50_07182 [Salinomyces thailandica]
MAEPPSYEETTAGDYHSYADEKGGTKGIQHFSIRQEIGASRSQHVAALVARLLPQVRERARSGLSRSTLLLLPSDQDCGCKGHLVGFPEDDVPIVVQLEGRHDTLEFWVQKQALDLLQEQMLDAVSDNLPATPVEIPLPPIEPPQARTSFFGRKASKATVEVQKPVRPEPVTVQVELDEVYFRTETEYGLMETLRKRAVIVNVVVR